MKIIIPALIFISAALPSVVFAESTVLSPRSLYDSKILGLEDSQSVGFIGRYDVGLSLKERDQKASYDLFGDDSGVGNAWVGVVDGQSQLRVGRHDSVDNMATVDADQHKADGAYDLIMRGDEVVPNSLTYINKSGPFSVGAQYAESDLEEGKQSVGVLFNTASGPYEASIAYRRTPENSSAIKGRVTYKSRNNSKIRVDVVAEKFEVGVGSDDVNASSTSFMVGAKCVPAIITDLYKSSTSFPISGVEPEVTFNIFSTVCSLSPGFILSGEYPA